MSAPRSPDRQGRPQMTRLRRSSAAVLGVTAVLFSLSASPVQAARPVERANQCVDAHEHGEAARGSGDQRGADHRDVSVREQRAIERQTKALLARKGLTAAEAAAAGGSVPVYFHVMLDAKGNGDVTQRQIDDQLAVLKRTFAGGESTAAANTG